jgi:hypothetical protein
MKLRYVLPAALAGLAGLAGCQAGGSGKAGHPSPNAALPVMERIAGAAQECWFRSRDEAFRPYRLANELNSFSGRPRLLLVPARSPESRPLLVIHAEGDPAKVEAFGPLMDGAAGTRIAADLKRWTAGARGCAA